MAMQAMVSIAMVSTNPDIRALNNHVGIPGAAPFKLMNMTIHSLVIYGICLPAIEW